MPTVFCSASYHDPTNQPVAHDIRVKAEVEGHKVLVGRKLIWRLVDAQVKVTRKFGGNLQRSGDLAIEGLLNFVDFLRQFGNLFVEAIHFYSDSADRLLSIELLRQPRPVHKFVLQ